MKKLLFSLSLLLSFGLNAQNDLPKCAEHTVTNKWLQEHPEHVDEYHRLKQEFNQYVEQYAQSAQGRARGVVYTVPVVFHIIHDYGQNNIDDAQIYDQMEVLNRDYRLQNADANNVVADFLGLPADIEIEFALATKKPNGDCFSGITRTVSTATSGSEGQQVSAVQQAHGNFPGDEYLNIFVVTSAAGAAGYTRQPYPTVWGGADMDNGIYIQHTYIGRIGTGSENRSRALTHEVGHWLGLSHPWGDSNNPGVSCGNDYVTDTPQTKGWTTCTLTGTTCDGQLDNVENYMEYSYCSKMFTNGQRTRMRAAITNGTGGRNNLWTSQNLAATGVSSGNTFCKADFTTEKHYTCLGGSIQFNDASYNDVSSWSWSATGGTPDNANIADPMITFNQDGIQPVTLTAGDGGSSDTETKADYIHVFPATPRTFPFAEDFDSYWMYPQAGLVYGYEDHPYGFELHTGVGASGTNSIKFNSFATPYGNLEREFVSYPIDLTSATAGDIEISFKTVYKETDNMTGSEKLVVYFSDDCGETWTYGRQWFSSQLEQGVSNFAYAPSSANEWLLSTHTIPNNFKVSNFMFKFTWKNNGGNNFYMDNININYVGNASISENVLEDLSVYPNPFQNSVTIRTGKELKNSNVQIWDARGKLIKTIDTDIIGDVVIPTSELAEGMYLLKVENKGLTRTFRIIK